MNVVFCGAPGSGKGTQCAKLAALHSLQVIATGDLFRAAAEKDTPLGKRVAQIFEAGRLVPDDVVLNVVHEELKSIKGDQGILFDGFPRTMSQATDLMTLLRALERKLTCVIMLNVERSVLEKRLTGRFICSKCAAVYNEYYKPTQEQGVCDACGGAEFERRQDDASSVVKIRLDEYEERIHQLSAYYEGLKLVRVIDGNGSVADVATSINAVLEGEI